VNEQEVVDIIDNIANRLANKFKFGYHETEDMKQQARMFAWEGISKWDGIRPLENFLWTHTRNRLYNYKRNNYSRPEKPCLACPLFVNKVCSKYDDERDCHLIKGWNERNDAKRNLMSSYSTVYDNPNRSNQSELFDDKEILNIVDAAIPIEYREDWIRLINNLKLPKFKQIALVEVIREILEDNDIDIDSME
jgi:hypothetical protein|tara:strand:- start:168 stop:746 length:579 start_codon:yes stop_codon:yes gene_type:complete